MAVAAVFPLVRETNRSAATLLTGGVRKRAKIFTGSIWQTVFPALERYDRPNFFRSSSSLGVLRNRRVPPRQDDDRRRNPQRSFAIRTRRFPGRRAFSTTIRFCPVEQS